MKILILSPEYPPIYGGIGNHVQNLCKKYVENGHEVTILTRAEVKNKKKIKFIRLKHFRLPLMSSRFFGIKAFKYLRNNFQKFEIVHLMHPMVFFSKQQYEFLKEKNLQIVSTFHGTVKSEMNAIKKYNSYKSLIDYGILIFGKIVMRYEQIALDYSNKLITVSKHNKIDILKNYKCKREIKIIYNGIDPYKTFKKVKNDNHILLFVGRFVGRKNIFLLPHIAKYLSKDKLIKFEFVLVGKGPLMKTFIKYINDMGIQKYFRIFSNLSDIQLEKIFLKAKLFVFPTNYEAQGIVLLEAIRSRTPCIVSKVGGIPEMIKHKKNGLLINKITAKNFAIEISKLLKDKKKYSLMSKNCRVEKKFQWDFIAKETLMYYQK